MTKLPVSMIVGLGQLTWFKEEEEKDNAQGFLEYIVQVQTGLQTSFFSIARFSPGAFKRVKTVEKDDTFIYVQNHPWKWASNVITYKLFHSALRGLVVQEKEITPCEEKLHQFLSPFFEGGGGGGGGGHNSCCCD